jgi:hypothetical protein
LYVPDNFQRGLKISYINLPQKLDEKILMPIFQIAKTVINMVVKIGVIKSGNIGTSPVLDLVLDERATA